MSSKSSFTFKNPMLNLLARWSGGKKLGVFFLWMLLIIPLYMLFEQTRRERPRVGAGGCSRRRRCAVDELHRVRADLRIA